MTRRLKRRAAPRSWTVPRKGTKWILRPRAGPHPQADSVPLLLVLRELRKLARTAREARRIVNAGAVEVDGVVVKDLARGVGLMDTVSFRAPLDEHYRVVRNVRGRLVLVKIPATEARVKIGRVKAKHSVPGGRIEATLHDGRNLLVEPTTPWHVGDSLKIELPSQKVVEHLPLAPGRLVYVAGGGHVGQLAHVERLEVRNSSQPNRVHLREGFSTIQEYVYVVGDQTPAVTLTEGVAP